MRLVKRESNPWPQLEHKNQSIKEDKPANPNEKSDPQASMMNMMKDMYDKGDDEMKRNIQKAWFESQNKKQ